MVRLLVLSILLLVASEQLQRLLILAQVLITHGLVEGDLLRDLDTVAADASG